MAKQEAYNGITITDTSGVGKLNAYLGSSQALNVVYDSSKTSSYSPNWEVNNLILTPFVQLDGEVLDLTSSNLTFIWERQIGSNSPTSLIDGETVNNGILTVSKNMLDNELNLITYICTITYNDPDIKEIELKTKTQLTFTLIENGQNAILFDIYVDGDYIISNENNDVVLKTIFHDGTNVITSDITYQWSRFVNDSYEILNGSTNDYLIVTPAMVNSSTPFKCQATYKGKTYQAFYAVTDKSDPLFVECISSLGDKIVNGSGVGGVYALVFQNGEQIDEIKSTVFLTENPSDTSLKYYYRVNTFSQTATLMKYSNDKKKWVEANAEDLPKCKYEWYRRDENGNYLDTTKPYKTGKVIYLDSTVVNKKITLRCKCTKYTEKDACAYTLTDESLNLITDEGSNSISTITYE